MNCCKNYSVEVGFAGPQGPPGPQGDPGAPGEGPTGAVQSASIRANQTYVTAHKITD